MAADTQSFSRAALTLNVKQSTLSRCVMQLENRLGVKLFERTTRGAKVTENGRVFIEQARRIVTDIENLQTTARNVSYGLQGRIAVGYCSPLISGNLKLTFSDYLTRFPDVQFDGVEAGPERLLNGLLSRTIDVAVAPIGLTEADSRLVCFGPSACSPFLSKAIGSSRRNEYIGRICDARSSSCRATASDRSLGI